jgi:hypothetical protein
MKKAIIVLSVLLFHSFYLFSQQEVAVGYSTTDLGGEYNYYSGGNIFSFHLAFNAKLHHSFILRAGYNAVNEKHTDQLSNEEGGGFTGGIGYRYYILPRPHRFFLGIRADYSKLNINWSNPPFSFGKYKTSNILVAAEAGYMLLINDLIFITPSVSAGSFFASKSLSSGHTKDGFAFLAGISAGVKF